jgi:DNA polymerase-3 subunit chi
VAEILFYHLHQMRAENVLPPLLEKSLAKGWRVVVQSSSAERVDALDAHLWTYRDDSFLPHGRSRDREAGKHPVVLTTENDNPNGATVRFLLDGVAVPDDAAGYERLVIVFNGDDDDEIAAARAAWSQCKAHGHDVTYWQADAQGRWQRKA